MQDLIFVALTFVCFGIGRLYVNACDRLKPRPLIDLKPQPAKGVQS